MPQHLKPRCIPLLIVAGLVRAPLAPAADQPQWGQAGSRNMVSVETGLPTRCDPETRGSLKWAVPLGSQTWSTPVVAQGRVFIGTNNENPRDPRHQGDRGILLCLDERDGHLLWQLVVPKLGPDRYLDWPRTGIVSAPTVEGDRVYTVTNRGELVCLDIHGQANGNDGPFQDEAGHMTPEGEPRREVTDADADILWLFDIPKQAGTYPHDGAHASILLDGDILYTNTSNGVDNTHARMPRPDGPTLIALDKRTGRLLARDRVGIGHRTLHSNWSSPALRTTGGQRQVVLGGGDGVVYGFAALDGPGPATESVPSLTRLWSFRCDVNTPPGDVHAYLRNRREGPSGIQGMPVCHGDHVLVASGGDIWWGKHEARLTCFQATDRGDLTATTPCWTHPLDGHCVSTPAVLGDLVFITDCGGWIRCLDLATGREHWAHEAVGDIWASPLVADGKVYVGTRRGRFLVFRAAAAKTLLAETRLNAPVAGTACAANGVLYVATMTRLYAFHRE